ncbi:ATP-binding protein [Acinetobacter rathckeae]|uniref:ATP-binding protein n=1 Tax=Acinetobacter rathckeae TaxID=2605272 RepID=UPI0018A2B037|nr:ATP-binding protein [Acinetobacter rathckeae]MBF7695097.1 ATP-binding protein [Acinetobacter rathckeae]
MTTKSIVAQKMQELKLHGCLDCFVDHYDEMIHSKKTSLEILNELLIAEQNAVSNRKVLALLTKSNIRYPTSNLTEIDCSNKQGLTSDILQSFADSSWIRSKHNLIFTGATGIGKTWLASAFGTNACKSGFKVLFYNTTELFEEFNAAVHLGTITTLKKKLLSSKLLILDDFGLSQVNSSWIAHFIAVIDKHCDNGSLLITSQYETNMWLNHFEDQTVGEALLDRIVHRSHVFNLKGESMRKKRGKKDI